MARIAGIDLPKTKRIDVALCYIYGIGKTIASRIIAESGVDPAIRVKDLSDSDVSKLNTIISKQFKVEGDLRREVQAHIRRLVEIGSYRGYRHRRNLPLRGQRTKTNARTRRGKRKTVGAGKAVKEAPKATA